jgi:hypothetical protein
MKPSAAARALALILTPALLTEVASAQTSQPGDRSPAPRAEPERPDARQDALPADPALAKRFLERRLEETTKREEHLKALLARLNTGESPADVGKDLEPARTGRDQARRSADQEQHAPRPERQGQRAKLSSEERDHALKFLHDNSEILGARFDRLMKSDPETAERVLAHMAPRIREAETLKEINPTLFKLRVEEMEGGAVLVDAIRAFREAKNASPQDPARLNQATEQLRSALAHQLDNRLSVQSNEIDSLTKRLAELKADLDKKRADREAAIDGMLAKVKDGKDVRELSPRDGDHRDRPGEPAAAAPRQPVSGEAPPKP